ncbi:MAG: T9SS type A sorting domain-containing protein [Bacteroidetes bacterium]|nr:T9SS type A sorting domain-containing protein [Bacteroidota bacterium]
MNKNLYLGVAIGTMAIGGVLLSRTINSGKSDHYSPRANNKTEQLSEEEEEFETFKGAAEYINSLRANVLTGEVDPADVRNALNQIEFHRRNYKSSFPLNWESAGPDNIGGRTRAILVDRNNPSVLYAGGVNGGLFKSTNKGGSWYPINDKFSSMAISSICQTANGDIFFGTGESFTGSGGQEAYTPGFTGDGIYRSTDDGKTFDRITTTGNFTFVNKLVQHPTKNIVFAATNLGLYIMTENDPTKWTLARGGTAEDVVVDKNGTVFLYAGRIFRSTDPTVSTSYTAATGVPNSTVRSVIAVSPEDPNYVYVVSTGSVTISSTSGSVQVPSGLLGIFQSKDNGVTFEKVVGQASAVFAPFSIPSIQHSQGAYDMCVAVHPRDKERIFIGGIEWAEWSAKTGPRIKGSTNDNPLNPVGIHSDKHVIAFDTVSNPIVMYIGSDGGIAKTTNADLTNYTSINNGYQTTQFYRIAAGRDGAVCGGTQDNNTIYINGKGSTPQAGVTIYGGDGFSCEISRIDPQVVFVLSQNGTLGRTLNAGGNASNIWDERIKAYFVDGTEPSLQASHIFNTPLQLWENTTTEESKLFFALDNEVWMANDAVRSPNPSWFRIANIGRDPHMMQITPDGNSLFVAGLNGSSIYRIDGIQKADWDTSALPENKISDSLTMVSVKGNLPGRTITDIEVDESNPNRVIVTMGNYGSSAYVYITEDGLSDNPTWRSIQGSLPQFPVYDAEISVENPDIIVLGTEYGIWACTNGTATTPTWVENNDNFPLIPVFMMRQMEKVHDTGPNPWRTGPVLFAGTHGRGIFKTNNLLTSVPKVEAKVTQKLKIYPNPSSDQTWVELPSGISGAVEITITSFSGQVVLNTSETAIGTGRISVDVSKLAAGNYIISVSGKNYKASNLFVKMN